MLGGLLVFEAKSLRLFCRYALHFLVQSGLTYGIMILTGVEHMHKYVSETPQITCFCSNITPPSLYQIISV